MVKTKKVLNVKPTTTEKTEDDCMTEGTECWNGWHYGPETERMEEPYIDADTDVPDFVEFTQEELEAKIACPSCCVRCNATEDPNTWK